jgi:hypothetical protein
MSLLSISPGSGIYWEPYRLRLLDGGPKYVFHSASALHFRDVIATLRFGNLDAITDNDKYGVIVRRINAPYLLYVWANATTLNMAKIEGGVVTEIVATWPLIAPLVADTDYWIGAEANGDTITAMLFTADPAIGAAPRDSHDYVLSAAEHDIWTVNTVYWTGFYLEVADNWAGAYIDDFDYAPITLVDLNVVTIENNGNFPAQPTIELYGAMTNPRVTNTATGEFVELKDTIPDGERWVIDIGARTVKDHNGNNKFSKLSIASGWPELIEGNNTIELDADDTSPRSRLRISYRDAWM